MMFWFGGGWALGPALLMWALMLAAVGVIVWAMSSLVSSLVGRPDHPGDPEGPRRVLDERLASGEIDAAGYRRLRDLVGAEGGTEVGSGARR